jgi:hypothetical protein
MPYKEIVKELKKYDPSTKVELSLNPGKKGLVEECQTRAEYEGYNVYFLASTCWRSSELRTTEMDVEDLMKVLKKKKLEKMTHKDFYGVSNENSIDGGMEFSDIEWDDDTPEEIKEEADMHDLYFKGDIDCECTFDGLDSIEIEVEGEYLTVVDED